MFKYQLDAFHQAKYKIRRHHTPAGIVFSADGKTLTAPTLDEQQADIWQRVLIVRLALTILNLEPRQEAGLAASNAYSAFAYKVEKYHV